MAIAKPFFDPHFHLWDVTKPNSVIDGNLIGPPAAMHPIYTVDVRQRQRETERD